MEYKLAKQLKDAGFPYSTCENCQESHACVVQHPTRNWFYTVPDLSELIEACGDRIECLYRRVQEGDGYKTKEWIAYAFIEGSGLGSTPEEAVARLWLELQKDIKVV